MSPTLDAFVRSWPSAPWLMAGLLVSGVIYLRGWSRLNLRDPTRWHIGRLVAFLSGLCAVFLALASPIEPFASLLLQVHMVQHLLLMIVAPPLIWLGWPLFAMLRGMPEALRKYWIEPLVRWRPLRTIFSILTRPSVAWPVYVAMTWFWHTPFGYELGLSRNSWHLAQHFSFFASALLFWYPVVRPYPSRPTWPLWILFPYLLLADVQNTVLCAWLTFSPEVLYPHYAEVPRLAGISALDDQRTAGVLMWVPGSIAFLLPLFWIGVGYLFDWQPDRIRKRSGGRAWLSTRAAVGQTPEAGYPTFEPAFDLLRVSLLGRFLRWRHSRFLMQAILALLAVAVIYDGLNGPQLSPMNLAGVLPWIHWRGLLILGLLVAGNLFCMACPFTLPRNLARRWLPAGRAWPARLRGKWLAVALVVLFLWSYEAFSLWDRPWTTAWIAITYFVAAFVIDGVFRGAAFCKYVCPIGQFNFVQSLVSPCEVKVSQPDLCGSCRTKDCIRGNATARGCELQLFQPRKVGSLDCTFCLDCVHACPHENVGILAVIPGRSLWHDSLRSGVGRLGKRPDIAALVLVLVFGAFANAAGMVAPVLEWQDRLQSGWGASRLLVVSICYFLAIIVVPCGAVWWAAILSRRWGAPGEGWLPVATRYCFALVPLGFAMWLAHYAFHLFTSAEAVIPATQRFLADRGWSLLGDPLWQCACCRPPMNWVTNFEILMLDLGLLLSLYVGFRITEASAANFSQAIKILSPWAALIVLLFMFGVWIIFQPMEMRGTLPPTG